MLKLILIITLCAAAAVSGEQQHDKTAKVHKKIIDPPRRQLIKNLLENKNVGEHKNNKNEEPTEAPKTVGRVSREAKKPVEQKKPKTEKKVKPTKAPKTDKKVEAPKKKDEPKKTL